MSPNPCSCHNYVEEPVLHTQNHSSCCKKSQDDNICSPNSTQKKRNHDYYDTEDLSMKKQSRRQRHETCTHKARRPSNPYKRRSSSVKTVESQISCGDCSRSPNHHACRNGSKKRRRSNASRSERGSAGTAGINESVHSMQLQRQQYIDRITELEGFCAELVK